MFYNTVSKKQYVEDTLFWRSLEGILSILIGALMITYCFLVPKTNINWDEFLYLAKIYDYQSGRHVSPLQSFYIHFFGWLTNISGTEIKQIIIARYVQLIILFCCMGIVYSIASKYAYRLEALFSVFLALGFTDVIRHGFSFRADPICLFFFLVSIYLLLKDRKVAAVFSGIFLAIGFLISIKTIFYIPTFLLLFITFFFTKKNPTQTSNVILIFLVSSFCSLSILYFLHNLILSSHLAELPQALTESQSTIAAAGAKVLWTGNFFPRRDFIYRSLVENFSTWYVILFGIYFSCKKIFSFRGEWRYIFLFGFTLQLFTLIFYRNAFPYFFVFIVPQALIISCAYTNLKELYPKKIGKRISAILIILPVSIALINSVKLIRYQLTDRIEPQRELVNLVHQLFPDPVPYIDRNYMIASFPQVGFWMSSWGMESYRQIGIPILKNSLKDQQPKFLIANTNALKIDDEKCFGENESLYRLLDEDFIALKENFVHHWGLLYLPGKYFNNLRKVKNIIFEIIIEGEYTVESDGNLEIDGEVANLGDVIYLEKGRHSIKSIDAGSVVLRFGSHSYRPDNYPSDKPIYTGL